MSKRARRFRTVTALVIAVAFARPAAGRVVASADQASTDAAANLRLAASKGDLRGIEGALREGADVNDVDEEGRSALMEATIASRLDAVRLLLTRGADPSAKSKAGLDALCYASLERHESWTRWNRWKQGMPKVPSVIRALLDAGASPSESTCFVDPDYLKRAPRRVAILPIADQRSPQEIKDSKTTPDKLANSIGKELKGRRYQVLAATDVAKTFSQNGIAPDHLRAVSAADACTLTGADGVLAIQFLGSSQKDLGIFRASGVAMTAVVTQCEPGRVLWKHFVAAGESRGVLLRPFISAERMIAMVFGTYFPRYPKSGDDTRDYSTEH